MSEIKLLSEAEHSRLRLEMYFGSRSSHTQNVLIYNEKPEIKEVTWVPALLTYFREIVDNALDEVVARKHGDRIDITYDEENYVFSVKDNGQGISLDWDEENKMYKATMALTKTRAGSNFDDSNRVTAGMNGVGASVTNQVSEYFKLTIKRDGKRFIQWFKEGKNDIIIEEPKITEITSDVTGTEIEFKPSKLAFKNLLLPLDFVKSRIYEVALCNPDIKFYFNGEKIKNNTTFEKAVFKDYNPIKIEIKDVDFKSIFYVVPNFANMNDDYAHSIVNNIPTFDGGSHINQFKSTFYNGILNELKKQWKKEKLEPKKSDLAEGTLIFNITNMKAPYFDSQTKTRLINEEVKKIINNQLADEKLYKQIIKKYPKWIENIKNKVIERTELNDLKDLKKSSKKNLRRSIPSLRDANSRDRSKCILIITEGRSAAGGFTSVRDPQTMGIMPLRGKILNVYNEKATRVYESETLANLMTAIGLSIGEKADRSKLRYKNLYVATDMDSDGIGSILPLICNFFYKYWPELFQGDDPFIRAFMTPFIIADKGKERKYWYLDNLKDFDNFNIKGWNITRAKGLGSLSNVDFRYVIDNIKYVPIKDMNNLCNFLRLAFDGNMSNNRKYWLTVAGEDFENATNNEMKWVGANNE